VPPLGEGRVLARQQAVQRVPQRQLQWRKEPLIGSKRISHCCHSCDTTTAVLTLVSQGSPQHKQCTDAVVWSWCRRDVTYTLASIRHDSVDSGIASAPVNAHQSHLNRRYANSQVRHEHGVKHAFGMATQPAVLQQITLRRQPEARRAEDAYESVHRQCDTCKGQQMSVSCVHDWARGRGEVEV